MGYEIASLDLQALFGPVSAATAALVRLDERLARSSVREGFLERQHFADAVAALWLEGELVHVEDLVLHDAYMDIRTPTHELTRAHGVLRVRRQIFGHKPDWALSADGLRQMARRGETAEAPAQGGSGAAAGHGDAGSGAGSQISDTRETDPAGPRALDLALAAVDLALGRSEKVIETVRRLPSGREAGRDGGPDSELVYDPEWDEVARLTEWRGLITATAALPTVLRAAVLMKAWQDIEVLQHASWLGSLLVVSLLRQEGLATHHLPSFNLGAKQIPRERRRAFDWTQRLVAFIDAIHEAALIGLKEHDRLLLAKGQMERKLAFKRKNSRLPDLIAFTLSRPLITASLVGKELKVSMQGALNLIGELGLREVTGRGRYRAWGVA